MPVKSVIKQTPQPPQQEKKNFIVYFLIILLVIVSFALGHLYTRVQLLEKGLGGGNSADKVAQEQPKKPSTDWKKLPKLSDYCTQDNKITTAKFPISRTKVKLTPDDMLCGSPDAKVTVIEFADFQCPFCGALTGLNLDMVANMKSRSADWESLTPNLLNDYIKSGKVNIVSKNYPFLGQESVWSAQAAHCASDQGKYWLYHDYLYSHQNGENQGAFSKENLKAFAKELKLNTGDFDKCLDGDKYLKLVTADKEEGTKNGVNGTPAIFINGKLISGAAPYSEFKTAIEAELNK